MKQQIETYGNLIFEYAKKNYRQCFREPDRLLKYKFIVPGSSYSNSLWDWDSWLTDIALSGIAEEDISEYEKGCILNFLDLVDNDGRMPIWIMPDKCNVGGKLPNGEEERNIHKPCLAQHALFISECHGNDADWLRDKLYLIEKYIEWYDINSLHESGLYVWITDNAIGVDNDPCTFYRPRKSSASIYLNCFMYKELLAIAKICDMLGIDDKQSVYKAKADALRDAIQLHCWDERDGCFYSVDTLLLPIDSNVSLHSGCPRHWNTLIQRIDVWSNFLPMWAGIATDEQAKQMVERHYKNERTFNSPYGVRTLGKTEKMYAVIKSGNPSCWLGPIWGISNYMVFEGLVKYGFLDEARELAEKTIAMFGKDIEVNGEPHEYYDPETGIGVNNPGYQDWNLLSVNMFEWWKNNCR